MPIYRYICENCGNEKVVLHSMNDNPVVVCEKCGSRMERTVGRVGIIFKGSGFYTTDYRDSKSKDSKSKEKEEAKT